MHTTNVNDNVEVAAFSAKALAESKESALVAFLSAYLLSSNANHADTDND